MIINLKIVLKSVPEIDVVKQNNISSIVGFANCLVNQKSMHIPRSGNSVNIYNNVFLVFIFKSLYYGINDIFTSMPITVRIASFAHFLVFYFVR